MGLRSRKMSRIPGGGFRHTVISRTFGEALRFHRLAARLSQRDLADRVGFGLSKATVSHLEAGHHEPLWVTACLLADALNISLDDLRTDRPLKKD